MYVEVIVTVALTAAIATPVLASAASMPSESPEPTTVTVTAGEGTDAVAPVAVFMAAVRFLIAFSQYVTQMSHGMSKLT